LFINIRVTICEAAGDLVTQSSRENNVSYSTTIKLLGIEGKLIPTGDVIEAAMPELMFVGRIDKGIGGREMRDRDLYDRVPASNTVDFFHRGDHVFAMLDHVVGSNFSEGVIGERPRAAVQIMDDIGMNADIAIDIDGIRKVLVTATQVENGFPHRSGTDSTLVLLSANELVSAVAQYSVATCSHKLSDIDELQSAR
jgi:hypothetical protein